MASTIDSVQSTCTHKNIASTINTLTDGLSLATTKFKEIKIVKLKRDKFVVVLVYDSS